MPTLPVAHYHSRILGESPVKWFMRKDDIDVLDQWLRAADDLYNTITDAAILSTDDARRRWNEVSLKRGQIDERKLISLTLEFFYFYYNVADRILFGKAGDEYRTRFLDLAYDLGVRPLIRSAFPNASGEELDQLALEPMENFDAAVTEYGSSNVLFPEARHTLTDVTFWQTTGQKLIPEFANTSLLTINIHDAIQDPAKIGKVVGLVHQIIQERLDLPLLESKVAGLAELSLPK